MHFITNFKLQELVETSSTYGIVFSLLNQAGIENVLAKEFLDVITKTIEVNQNGEVGFIVSFFACSKSNRILAVIQGSDTNSRILMPDANKEPRYINIKRHPATNGVQIGVSLPNERKFNEPIIFNWLELAYRSDNKQDVQSELARAAYAELNAKLNQESRSGSGLTLADEKEMMNEEILDFAHLIAHDLKSPLNNVTTILNMLDDELRGSAAKRYSEILLLQCDKMREFIDLVLTFSKSGNEAVSLEKVNLNILLENLKSYLSIPANVNMEVQDKLPEINYTLSEIQMVFQNLITNAIKYNRSEQIVIKIWAEETAESIQLFCQDNGIGISEENQTQLFKFGKILSDMAIDDSSGVGLSIIKNIIEKHGGEIKVDSKEGKGTTFYFTIPKA